MNQLIGNLRLWQKLVLVLACFTIPLFSLGSTMLGEINEQIYKAQLEIAGSEVIGPVLKLHSDALNSRFKGSRSTSQELATDITPKLENFKRIASQIDTNTQSAIDTTNLSTRVQRLYMNRDFAGTLEGSQEAIDVVTELADKSGLSLDPALDSYYLVIVATVIGPRLMQELTTGLISSATLDNAGFSEFERALLANRITRLAEVELPQALKKIEESDPLYYETSPTLVPRLNASLTQFSSSVKELEKTLLTKGNAIDHSKLQQQFLNAITITAALLVTATEELGIVVHHRVTFHENLAANAWIACGLGLALLPGVAWLVIRSITSPIGELIRISLLAAEKGDLTNQLNVNTRDEVGMLASAFNKMTANLRAMIEQVQISGKLVQGSSTSISATAKQQQATASEIAATTLQIEATSKEISVTSAQLATTIKEVAAVADQTTSLASTGREGIIRMEDTMLSITEACKAISDRLAVLSDKAGKIGSVVTTINKVADQTNLLSLNAAIEAEKAGEVGRGFAVVATEIRRLADQTAISTGDIEAMIKEIQSAISAGVMGVERFADEVRRGVGEVKNVGGQLGEIISQVQGLPAHIEAVREGMESQALGARQITDGLGQLSQAAQQTADSLRSSTECIDQLREASNVLEIGISKFVIKGGANAVS